MMSVFAAAVTLFVWQTLGGVAASDDGVACLQTMLTSMGTVAGQNYTYFGDAMAASGFKLSPGQAYTVFVPNDQAFGALLTQYGIDVTSTSTIAESPYITSLAQFLRYYVVPGNHTIAELVTLAAQGPVQTLFNASTDGIVCQGSSSGASTAIHPSDGNLQFGMRGTVPFVLDDATYTPQANVTKTDIATSCNVIVDLLDAVLDPCAPDILVSAPPASTAPTSSSAAPGHVTVALSALACCALLLAF